MKECTYEEVLEEAYNSWTPGSDIAQERRDTLKKFLDQRTEEYANHFKISKEEVFQRMEKRRNYSANNYYQSANFPSIKDISMTFETEQDMQSFFSTNKTTCPACKGISDNPLVCTSGIKKRGKVCDWKSFGLLQSPFTIMCKELFLENFRVYRTFTPIGYTDEGKCIK